MGDSLYSIEGSYISEFVLIQHILSTQVRSFLYYFVIF